MFSQLTREKNGNLKPRTSQAKKDSQKRCRAFKRSYSKSSKLCAHGYRFRYYCISCSPENACPCGSNKHFKSCCEHLRQKQLKHFTTFSKHCFKNKVFEGSQFEKDIHQLTYSQGNSSSVQPPPPPPLSSSSEPVKKMQKVILGGVEMQVEEGSTMTIGGVSVVLG